MTSGLQADHLQMTESADWAQFALNQPMINDPGKSFDYNCGNTHLLSAIIQKTTGRTAFDYAQEKLFRPLGVQDVYWGSDLSGFTTGGTGLMLTPRDMAKFGLLYLNRGEWDGKQIVQAEWVVASLQKNSKGYTYQ